MVKVCTTHTNITILCISAGRVDSSQPGWVSHTSPLGSFVSITAMRHCLQQYLSSGCLDSVPFFSNEDTKHWTRGSVAYVTKHAYSFLITVWVLPAKAFLSFHVSVFWDLTEQFCIVIESCRYIQGVSAP